MSYWAKVRCALGAHPFGRWKSRPAVNRRVRDCRRCGLRDWEYLPTAEPVRPWPSGQVSRDQ